MTAFVDFCSDTRGFSGQGQKRNSFSVEEYSWIVAPETFAFFALLAIVAHEGPSMQKSFQLPLKWSSASWGFLGVISLFLSFVFLISSG
jgi:hypothetical protein